jgi:glutaredoxin-related protein
VASPRVCPPSELLFSATLQRISPHSGLQLYVTIRTAADEDLFLAHALDALRTHGTGCTHLALSYDVAIRATLADHNLHKRDTRQPKAIYALVERAVPQLNFDDDYVGGCQTVMEMMLQKNMAKL